MKHIVYLGILILLLASTNVAAKESISVETVTSAGVTPDSLFYFADLSMDALAISFQLNSAEKAAKSLEVSQERLLEFEAMLEAKDMSSAQLAEEEHGRSMASAKTAIENMHEENATEELELELILDAEVQAQQDRIEELKMRTEEDSTFDFDSETASLFLDLEIQVASVQDLLNEKEEETKNEIEEEGGDADAIELDLSTTLGIFEQEESSADAEASTSIEISGSIEGDYSAYEQENSSEGGASAEAESSIVIDTDY